jgi:DNA helicase-2/ATP-dependent DNA helicase PcrA
MLAQMEWEDWEELAEVAKRLRRAQARPPGREKDIGEDTVSPPPLSLVEALDWLRTKPDTDDIWAPFSPEGRARLKNAALLIHSRRRYTHDDLIDQLAGCEKAWGLDIERVANPERNDSDKSRAALFDAASTYQATSDSPSVSGFIDWLQEAEWRDNLQPQTDEAEPGCVQVLTIHGAKGLEWDHVALARVVEDELPAAPRDGTRGWLKRGELPYPLRGDRDHLPHFSWEGQETRKDVKDAAAAFFAEVGDWRLSEERRLMYVGVTRAKKDVGLFGSWWATQKKPRRPSLFLRELADSGLVPALPDQPENDDNPTESREGDFLWPGDPLGERRDQVTDLADRVTGLMATMPDGIERADRDTVDDLIARAMTPPETLRPPIPVRLAASTLPGILADPVAVMQKRARPLPRRVRGNERAGTVFHEWVENHYRAAGNISLGGDWDPDETDTTPSEAQSDQWREAFLASEFAKKTPLAIEREIYLPVAGHTVVCKIDAVFATEKGVDIIDWKTGRPPATPEEETTRALQLSLYRMAWSAWSGTPLEAITVGWWFSTTGDVRRPRIVWEPDAIVSALNSALAGYWSRETKA